LNWINWALTSGHKQHQNWSHMNRITSDFAMPTYDCIAWAYLHCRLWEEEFGTTYMLGEFFQPFPILPYWWRNAPALILRWRQRFERRTHAFQEIYRALLVKEYKSDKISRNLADISKFIPLCQKFIHKNRLNVNGFTWLRVRNKDLIWPRIPRAIYQNLLFSWNAPQFPVNWVNQSRYYSSYEPFFVCNNNV
jgi:hypothetical protein